MISPVAGALAGGKITKLPPLSVQSGCCLVRIERETVAGIRRRGPAHFRAAKHVPDPHPDTVYSGRVADLHRCAPRRFVAYLGGGGTRQLNTGENSPKRSMANAKPSARLYDFDLDWLARNPIPPTTVPVFSDSTGG